MAATKEELKTKIKTFVTKYNKPFNFDGLDAGIKEQYNIWSENYANELTDILWDLSVTDRKVDSGIPVEVGTLTGETSEQGTII